MIDQSVSQNGLRDFVAKQQINGARTDRASHDFAPALQYLITNKDISTFNEEVIVRVRSMVASLAADLLSALYGERYADICSEAELEVVVAALLDQPSVLGHLHAQALEMQMVLSLHRSLGIDPLMSPVLRRYIQSENVLMQKGAHSFLTAQSTWLRGQNIMSCSIYDLPPQILDLVLYTLQALAGVDEELRQKGTLTEHAIRQTYAAMPNRLILAEQLVTELVGEAGIFSVKDAGLSLFLTSVSMACRISRDQQVLSACEENMERLALALSAIGLPQDAVMAQLRVFRPDLHLIDELYITGMQKHDVAVNEGIYGGLNSL